MRIVIRLSGALQRLVLFVFLVAVGFHSPLAFAELSFVTLPEIENNEVTPRVIYIENPRFPKVDMQDLWKVFQSAADLVQEHFGVTVKRPSSIRILDIDDIFVRDVVRKKRAELRR